MKESLREKGLTLIALIVTIILLLILAVITINSITNINKKAVKASEKTQIEEEKEKIYLAWQSLEMDYISADVKTTDINFQKALEENQCKASVKYYKEDNYYLIKIENSNHYYSVDENGEINFIDNVDLFLYADKYVKSGLVLHLSGKENSKKGHLNNTSSWFDISEKSNKNATLTKGKVNWDENALILDGTTYWTVDTPILGSFCTAEVCVSIDKDFKPYNTDRWYRCSTILGCELPFTQKDWGIIIDKDGFFAIGYDDSTIYSSNINALDGKKHTISYSYLNDKLIFAIDGNIINKIVYYPNGQSCAQFGIGWNKANVNTAIKGKIYDVRFYEPVSKEDNVLNLNGVNNIESAHSNSTSTWYDISKKSNKNATLTKGNVNWDEDALILDGTTYWTVDAPVNDSLGTAEVCVSIDKDFKPSNTDQWYRCSTIFGCELPDIQKDWGIIIDKNGFFAIGYDNSTIYSSKINALDGKKHTISYSYLNDKLIFAIDGNTINKIEYYPRGQSCSQFGIGWNKANGSTAIKGKIYYVKFYNNTIKVLSDAERKANYLADQE